MEKQAGIVVLEFLAVTALGAIVGFYSIQACRLLLEDDGKEEKPQPIVEVHLGGRGFR